MSEYKPAFPGGNCRWHVQVKNPSDRRDILRGILEDGGHRAATAWLHNLYGITYGNNYEDHRRYPLKWLWYDLLRKAGTANHFEWFVGRGCHVNRSKHDYLLVLSLDLDTIDGTLRLIKAGYTSGSQFYWDRDPSPCERFELMFVMEPHYVPVYDLMT